jgi:PAS domain S-box-containing protein
VEVHEAPIVDEGKTVSIVGALVDITERKKNEEKIKNQNKKYKQLYNELKKYSEQLQKSNELIAQKEQHFRLLVDNAPDAIFIQTNWKFQYVNKKALELFGATNSEQLIGKPILNRFHPDFHEQIKERIKGLNEEKEKQDQAELVCIKLDGTETDVETSGIPFTYYNQDGALVFARDITDRKKAEETLKESQERFKALFYENSSVLIIVDPDTGNIYDVNNKAVEFYGYSKEEMRSMNVQKLNILPDRQIKEEMEKAIKGEKNYFNFPHRLANGEIKDVEVYTGKIYIEGKAYIYSTIHDITEDTRNRMRLQKGEEIAGIGHWEYDLNSGNVYASEGAKKIYGLHKSHLTIKEVQQIPLKEYRTMMDNALERLVKDGEPYDIEFQIKRPTDQKIVDIHSIGEYNPERNVVFGIIQDISERKRFEKELQRKNEELQAAEEELRVSNEELRDTNQRLEEQKQELEEAKEKAEESDRLKSAFLANMSHEIRTPMNGIMGFSQVLLESDFSEKKRNKFLKIIHSRSRHLLQIINDIVDISKIEANQFDIHTEEFCLNDMLHELYETYQTDKISYGKEHLDIQLEKGLNKRKSYINSDVKRLRQILTNLIGNALKFTEKGKIKFGYTLHNEQTLLFYVSDTGIGISQKNQGYIFERFRQLDDSSNRLNEGTGLGLTISKNLSELLGGSMWMESTEGKGSTFYFTIPYNKQKSEKMEDKSRDQKGYKWKGKKILVIEDDPTSQEFIKEVLRPTEAELIFSETGEIGLQKYEEQDIDLILMDIRLPGKNGIEITRKIRQKDGDIRIIAQTAYAMSEDRKKCMDAGANDYISKPIDPDDLMTKMNQHV